MNVQKKFASAKGAHVVNILRKADDPIVQNGLAITPADMLAMHNQGFSISAQNARMLQEVKPDSYSRMEVPLEFTRHFDIADAYQVQQAIHEKVRNAVNNLKFE